MSDMESESESDGGMQLITNPTVDFWGDERSDLETADLDSPEIDVQSDMDTPPGGWTFQGPRETTGDTGTITHSLTMFIYPSVSHEPPPLPISDTRKPSDSTKLHHSLI